MKETSYFYSIILIIVFGLISSLLYSDQNSVVTARRIISEKFKIPAEKSVKIAFFDADSTLRVAPSGKPSANSPDDVAILPMLAGPMRKLEQEGYLIAIVSNQAGVMYGHITLEIARQALVKTINDLALKGVTIHYFDFAENEDSDRKPETGMGDRLAGLVKEKLGCAIDWKNSIMVGDSGWKKGKDLEPDGTPGDDFSNTDRLFAENLNKKYGGVKFIHPRDFFGWIKLGIKNFKDFPSLKEFLETHPEK